MVSIHIVPVIAYLIIRRIYSTFRFKRGESVPVTRPTHRGSRIAHQSERATPIAHADMYSQHSILVWYKYTTAKTYPVDIYRYFASDWF